MGMCWLYVLVNAALTVAAYKQWSNGPRLSLDTNAPHMKSDDIDLTCLSVVYVHVACISAYACSCLTCTSMYNRGMVAGCFQVNRLKRRNFPTSQLQQPSKCMAVGF